MRKINDYYSRKAKKDKYPARSVYKLEEVQKKYRILKPGQRVLEVGPGPGRLLLSAAQRVAPNGEVVGIDSSKVSVRVGESADLLEVVCDTKQLQQNRALSKRHLKALLFARFHCECPILLGKLK